MKLTVAFFSIILTVGFGACSTVPTKKVTLVPCCTSGEAEKTVLLQDSWAEGGRVVRLAPREAAL
jgi:hypothetical protein